MNYSIFFNNFSLEFEMKIFRKRERKKKFEDREEETQKDRGMEKKEKGHEDR